jgi:hypothetical protein
MARESQKVLLQRIYPFAGALLNRDILMLAIKALLPLTLHVQKDAIHYYEIHDKIFNSKIYM